MTHVETCSTKLLHNYISHLNADEIRTTLARIFFAMTMSEWRNWALLSHHNRSRFAIEMWNWRQSPFYSRRLIQKMCGFFLSLSLCLFHFTKLCHFQRTVKYATSDIVCSGLCASVQPTPTRQLFSFVPFFLQFNSKNFAICRKKEKSEWVKLLRQLFCSKYSKTLRKASHYQLNSLRVRSQPFVGESWPRTKTERERHKHEERI